MRRPFLLKTCRRAPARVLLLVFSVNPVVGGGGGGREEEIWWVLLLW